MAFKEGLRVVAERDIEVLVQKDAEYGGSWKQRGGPGAFFMLSRKWDRLETYLRPRNYDIFEAVAGDDREEGVADDIGDLRRYLMLVEQEMRARGKWPGVAPPPAEPVARPVAKAARIMVRTANGEYERRLIDQRDELKAEEAGWEQGEKAPESREPLVPRRSGGCERPFGYEPEE